jgi:protein TonB
MKDFDDIFKQRLEGYEMKLPDTDRDAFLNRQATRERFARRRRTYLSIAVGLPAVAAIIMALVFTISLFSKQDDVPVNNTQTPAVQEQVIPAQGNEGIAEDDADIMICIDGDDHWVTLDGDDDWGKPMETSVLSQSPGEEDVFLVVEESPEFPGGTNALMGYLRDNMVIPDSCRENNIQGRVLVTFIVEKDGSITKPVVVKSVNHLLDAEALRLVSAMPKWKPGRQNGQAQRVKFTIPINFRLDYYKNRTKATATESAVEDIMASTKDKTF